MAYINEESMFQHIQKVYNDSRENPEFVSVNRAKGELNSGLYEARIGNVSVISHSAIAALRSLYDVICSPTPSS